MLALLVVACSGDPAAPPPVANTPATKVAPAAPSLPPTTPAVEPPPLSRPPLVKRGTAYVGNVVDACPVGTQVTKPEGSLTLTGNELTMSLFSGGCPRWAGHWLVARPTNPLEVEVCVDIEHDPCESLGSATWVFDVGDAVKASGATTAVLSKTPAGTKVLPTLTPPPLVKTGANHYRGVVTDHCPVGAWTVEATAWTLAGKSLQVHTIGGGCPTSGLWLVHGAGDPLAFSLCAVPDYDKCQALVDTTWEFTLPIDPLTQRARYTAQSVSRPDEECCCDLPGDRGFYGTAQQCALTQDGVCGPACEAGHGDQLDARWPGNE